MMMFETSKHVPKTEKRCCVFKVNQIYVITRTDALLILNPWHINEGYENKRLRFLVPAWIWRDSLILLATCSVTGSSVS